MKSDVLKVQMFGSFAMTYQGKPLAFERNAVSKTSQLLQILLLHFEEGVTKETLLESLYGRDNVENRNDSLNNTIFRLRKKLKESGLPGGHYFGQVDNVYKWDETIPVEIDIHVFEQKLKAGEQTEEEEERVRLFKEACTLYTGEFLPLMAGEDWAAVANIAYQKRYFAALLEVCEYLKKRKRFEEIYELTTAAAKIYHFEEWQIWRIDSLIAMNRYQEAMHIYKETTSYFFDELGISPSPEMLERFRLMSDRIQQSVSAIEEIKNGLKENGTRTGAYYCTFPSFIDIYHVISRMMERNGISVFIMLCTLTDRRGNIQTGTKKNKEASECLRQAICDSLRRGDFYTRYNESQFLIMLSGAKQENCGTISVRIDKQFKETFNGSHKINYYVASVAELEAENTEDDLTFVPIPNTWRV